MNNTEHDIYNKVLDSEKKLLFSLNSYTTRERKYPRSDQIKFLRQEFLDCLYAFEKNTEEHRISIKR